MPKERNHYSVDIKAKVALAAMKGHHTVNEIAATFGVHPHQVVQWKKQALEALPDAFSSRRVREVQGEEALKAQLYHPYLLKDVVIASADQVWSADMTYIRLPQGFVYLVAIMDWYSRYV